MKGILQWATDAGGPWKHAGVVRTRDDQDYNINAITVDNRLDQPEAVRYEVIVKAKALRLTTWFTTQPQWYFRILFLKESQYIYIGQRKYSVDHDGLLGRQEIVHHIITLRFLIDIDDYLDYTIPLDLPQTEGAIILGDEAAYV